MWSFVHSQSVISWVWNERMNAIALTWHILCWINVKSLEHMQLESDQKATKLSMIWQLSNFNEICLVYIFLALVSLCSSATPPALFFVRILSHSISLFLSFSVFNPFPALSLSSSLLLFRFAVSFCYFFHLGWCCLGGIAFYRCWWR